MAYTNIDDPSAHFQTAIYTGNGGSDRAIVNDGNSAMQPDWVWYKSRSNASSHITYDSTRGDGPYLKPSDDGDEGTDANMFESFDSDGFSLNGDTDGNGSGRTYVAWQWKANGGTTASNTDGTITSTVQANQDAGFSIVTYTGTGVYNQTVGHGLGVAPAVVILKNRTTGEGSYDDWWVYHQNLSNPKNRALRLNETGAEQASTTFWSVVPSSTIFGVGGSVDAPRYTNGASQNYVAYAFAEKQGYSKFGKYVGNGNANGTFVYTGFKPAFVILKGSSASGSWYMLDSKRDVDNVAHHALEAQSAAAEYTNYNFIDMLSNGFKLRLGTSEVNTSGNSYIYMAFAENPFVTSTGIPTTAR